MPTTDSVNLRVAPITHEDHDGLLTFLRNVPRG